VEPICWVLAAASVAIAPTTYYAAKTRPSSARSLRDEQLKTEITRVFDTATACMAPTRSGSSCTETASVGRCTVEGLMRQLGLRGAACGKAKIYRSSVAASWRVAGSGRAGDTILPSRPPHGLSSPPRRPGLV
ncbi:MAG: hypothetical protein M3302_09185, partial [Actinomycetota bacterium]|nr:hypothetical protein [Actinomycetota bacterium]